MVPGLPAGRIVDLSMPIATHFRWKVDREESGDFARGDQYLATRLSMSCHGFTHIDAPRHIMADGASTDALELDAVVGPALVVDLTDLAPNQPVTAALLESRRPDIGRGARVLLKSGWDRQRSPATPEFWHDAPYFTRDAAEWLLARGIRTIAYDFPQDYPIRQMMKGERVPFDQHVTHDVLLRNGVVMIEYLCNTAALTRAEVFLCALPLKVTRADGAPARVIAIETQS